MVTETNTVTEEVEVTRVVTETETVTEEVPVEVTRVVTEEVVVSGTELPRDETAVLQWFPVEPGCLLESLLRQLQQPDCHRAERCEHSRHVRNPVHVQSARWQAVSAAG